MSGGQQVQGGPLLAPNHTQTRPSPSSALLYIAIRQAIMHVLYTVLSVRRHLWMPGWRCWIGWAIQLEQTDSIIQSCDEMLRFQNRVRRCAKKEENIRPAGRTRIRTSETAAACLSAAPRAVSILPAPAFQLVLDSRSHWFKDHTCIDAVSIIMILLFVRSAWLALHCISVR